MLGRLVSSADFEYVLGQKPHARSAHFAVHYAPLRPTIGARCRRGPTSSDLSTDDAPHCPQAVDELSAGVRLGAVVPKRLARRAVMRNMIKRQVRAAFAQPSVQLAAGFWLVRLRAPFGRETFASADSAAARAVARDELRDLVQRLGAADLERR